MSDSGTRDRERLPTRTVAAQSSTGWQTKFFLREKSRPTVEKHRLLGEAFAAWLREPVDADGARLVFDGFAGAGAFAARDEEITPAIADARCGSPLLLLRWAQHLAQARPLRFVFAEKNAVNFTRLCAAVGDFLEQPTAATYVAPMGRVDIEHTSFEACAARLLALPKSASAPGSLFSFVDPYSYDGLRCATLVALAARGALTVHVAAEAICTKLLSAGGASLRQTKRMDLLFGEVDAWTTLRQLAASLPAQQVKKLVAETMQRGLQTHDGVESSRLAALRDGDTFLLTARGRSQRARLART